MKLNHEIIRKYLRIVGIVFFIFMGFMKFKKLIDNGGKEEPIGPKDEAAPAPTKSDDDDD